MDYRAAVDSLYRRERFGIKLGLENIERLVAALGHPERSYRSILVAGTNGKGSTAAFIESMFRASGYRTGLYTSPHLVSFEERIQVRGEPVAERELVVLVTDVEEIIRRLRDQGELLTEPTFFEVATACGFEHFRRRAVELAILEVGMGGRWDATNVAPIEVAVITRIALDHERYLGSTLAAIAREKAGIIREGTPVVTSVAEKEAVAVIRAAAKRQKAPLHQVHDDVEVVAREVSGGQRVQLRTPEREYRDLFLPLAGEHQLENLALAVRVVEVAGARGLSVEPEAMATGIGSTHWPARLERVSRQPELLIDAAHNPDGALALGRYLEQHPRADRVLLFAVMSDKNIDAILEALLPHAAQLVVTAPLTRRAADPHQVAAMAAARGFSARAQVPVEAALSTAFSLAGSTGEVVVAGSLYLAGEVKRLLGPREPGGPA